MTSPRLAIVSAMHEELRALLPSLQDPRTLAIAGRTFHTGTMHGRPVVLVLSGIGKVAVDLVGACKIPFAPDHIKKFEARSAIGKKRKSPKC